jgi:hypothetical protein
MSIFHIINFKKKIMDTGVHKVKISTFENVNNLNDKTSKINYINKTIKEEEKFHNVGRKV